MGTRIHVTFEHNLSDHRDVSTTIDVLAPTLPAALAVANYWRSVGSNPESNCDRWTSYPWLPELGCSRYRGPGCLFLNIGPKIALIFTGARWRGFLSIEPLRRVHLAAFRSIAKTFDAKQLAYFPSEGVADDIDPGSGLTQDECIAMLKGAYGDSQPSVEEVSPHVIAETESCAPSVWYMETLRG